MQLRYSPSAATVRERLALGLETLRQLDAKGCFPAKHRVVWPEFKRTRGELFAADMDAEVLVERVTITRLKATNAGIDALLTDALPWLYSIADLRHRKATFLRHYHQRIGWRRVAALLNADGIPCSHNSAKYWEEMGVETIRRMARAGD